MIVQLAVALLLLAIWIRERGRSLASNKQQRRSRGLAAFRRIEPPPTLEL